MDGHPAAATPPARPPPVPGKCAFYLGDAKRRYCRASAIAGQQYCGNHLHLSNEGAAAGAAACKPRVSCPIDPSHTVVAAELAQHLKKCPKLLEQQRERALRHFCEDVNAGSDAEPELPQLAQKQQAVQQQEALAAIPPPDDPGVGAQAGGAQAAPAPAGSSAAAAAEACAVAAGWQPAAGPFCKGRAAQRAALAASLGHAGMERLIEKVERAYAEVLLGGAALACHVLRPPECEPMLSGSLKMWPCSTKHCRQQASIVGNMQRIGLLASGPAGGSGLAVVELGAGKGYLGGMLAMSCGVAALVATDIQSGFQAKADRYLRNFGFARHRLDLKDYLPAHTPEIARLPPAAPWLAIGKHLCGAATDYALRACLAPPPAGPAAEVSGPTAAAAVIEQGDAAAGAAAGSVGGHACAAASSSDAGARATEAEACSLDAAAAAGATPTDRAAGCGTARSSSSSNSGGTVNGVAAAHAAAGHTGPSFRGLAIAPCCHHRCGWRAFVGKEMFRRLGLTPQEFELVSWMTGWALCGHDAPAGLGADPEAQADEDGDAADGDGDGVGCKEGDGDGVDEGLRDCGAAGRGNGEGAGTAATPCKTDDSPPAAASAAAAPAPAACQTGGPYRSNKRSSRSDSGAAESDDPTTAGDAAAIDIGGPLAVGRDNASSAAAGGQAAASAVAAPTAAFDPAQAFPRARRMSVGMMCKLLIDRARLEWLCGRVGAGSAGGGDAELVCYIQPEVSGENRLLLARVGTRTPEASCD